MSTSRRRFGRFELPDGRRVFALLEGDSLEIFIAEIGTLRVSVIAAP